MSISNEKKFRLDRPTTSSSVWVSRTTDLLDPDTSLPATALKVSFSIVFPNSVPSAAPSLSVWIGNAFTGSGDSSFPSTGFARVGFVPISTSTPGIPGTPGTPPCIPDTPGTPGTPGTFALRNFTAETDVGAFSGEQNVTLVLNNSGAALNYVAPNKTLVLLPDQRYSVWIGPLQIIAESPLESGRAPGLALTDFKILLSNGPGGVTADIDSLRVNKLENLLYPSLMQFRQEFTDPNIANYFEASGSPNKFNQMVVSGGGTATIVGGRLRLDRPSTTSSVWVSRTTDLAPAAPGAAKFSFSVAFPGGAASAAPSLSVWSGSGFTGAGDSSFPTSGFARIGFVPTSAAGAFTVRNFTTGTNVGAFSGTQTITWVLNDAGEPLDYVGPDGSFKTLPDQSYSVWVGTSEIINGSGLEAGRAPGISLTDFKILLNNGPGGVQVDLDNVTVSRLANVVDISVLGVLPYSIESASLDEADRIRMALAGHPALYFPSGRYRLGSAISVPSHRIIYGAGKTGPNATVFVPRASTASQPDPIVDDVTPFLILSETDVSLANFAIDCPILPLYQSNPGGPFVKNDRHGSMKSAISVQRAGSGLRPARIKLDGIRVVNRRSRAPAISFKDSDDCSVQRCDLENNMMRIYVPPEGSQAGDPCIAWQVYGVGINFGRCQRLNLSYNRIYENDGTGGLYGGTENRIHAMLETRFLPTEPLTEKYQRFFQPSSIQVVDSTDAEIKYNWIKYAGQAMDLNGTSSTTDEGLVGTFGSMVVGNVVDDSHSAGLKFAHNVAFQHLTNNWIRRAGWKGVVLGAQNASTRNCEVSDNIFISIGKGIGGGWWNLLPNGQPRPDIPACIHLPEAQNESARSHHNTLIGNTSYDNYLDANGHGLAELARPPAGTLVVIYEVPPVPYPHYDNIITNNLFAAETALVPCFIAGQPPAGKMGLSYSFEFTAVAGHPTVPTLSLSGSLPPGITLNGAAISGTPTASGAYTATITASNGVGASAAITFTISIAP